MRTLSALAAVAVLATAPVAINAQSRPGDDHSTHHPAPAQAAPTQAAPSAPGGRMGGMMGGSDMGRMMASMHGGMMGGAPLKHVEGRLAFLKTELKITPAQEPQWTRFADVVRSTAKAAQETKSPMMQGGAKASTAPDRLARYEMALAARLETVRALKGAFDPLYGTLSDEQKKAADELVTGSMGIM